MDEVGRDGEGEGGFAQERKKDNACSCACELCGGENA